MRLVPIRSDYVWHVWDAAKPFIEAAAAKGPTRDLDVNDLYLGCEAGRHQLWLLVTPDNSLKAVAVTGIHQTSRRVCEWIVYSGGRDEIDSSFMKDIEAWAKGQGCEAMRSYGRVGMREIMPKDYKVKGYIFEKALKNG